MKSILKCFLLFISASVFTFCSHEEKSGEMKILLSGDWIIKSSIQVKEDGEIISTDKFNPKGWYRAKVPTTVLNALIKDSVYQDPGLD